MEQTKATIGTSTPENVIGKLFRNEAGWGTIPAFVERVLRLKREEGHPEDSAEALRTYVPRSILRINRNE